MRRGRVERMLDSDDRGVELHLGLGALVILVALGLSVYFAVKSGGFDIVTFAQGMGLLFTGVGLAGAAQGLQRWAQGPRRDPAA